MKLFIPFILFSILSFSTQDINNDTNNNRSLKIISKSIAFDEQLSQNLKRCDENESNSLNSCLYEFDGRRFVKSETIVYDENGKASKFYYYGSDGPSIYSKDDFERDDKLNKLFNFNDHQISINSQNEIVDNGDIVTKFEKIEKFKVIIATSINYTNSKIHKGRVVIYEYE